MTDDMYDNMMIGFKIFVLILLILFVGGLAYWYGHNTTIKILKPAVEALVSTSTVESNASTDTLALEGQIQELKDENEYLTNQIEAYKQLADTAEKNADAAMKRVNELESKPPETVYVYVPETTITVPPGKKGK